MSSFVMAPASAASWLPVCRRSWKWNSAGSPTFPGRRCPVARRYGGPGWGLATCERGLPGRSGSWPVEPQMWEAPVGPNRTSVGLDVHARSVVACGLDGQTGELFERRLTPDHAEIIGWVRSLPGPAAVTYEAGPTGFGLARFLTAKGIDTLVAAPSKLQRPSGDRVKTDVRDARHLARLLHLGEIVAVAVPSVEQEAARDLVRAGEDVRGDLMSARHRLSKLLLRQGIVYSGGALWTGAHDRWLRDQRRGPVFDTPGLGTAFDVAYDTVLATTARRDRLDAAITAMAADSSYTPVVTRLGCLRGVATLTAFGLAVEIGDWHRLTGRSIGA